MKIPQQLSLKQNIVLGFVGIVLITAVLAVIGLMHMAETNRTVEQIASNSHAKAALVYKMKDALRERRAVAQRLLLLPDPITQNDETLALNKLGTAFTEARASFEALPLSAEEQAVLDRLLIQTARTQPLLAEAIDQVTKGNTARASKIIELEIPAAHQSITAELDTLLTLQKREAENVVSDGRAAFEYTRLHMLILGSFAIGLGLLVIPMLLRKANKQTEMVQHLGMFDLLTNLPNGLLLADRLQQIVLTARHEQRSFGLFVLDLDRFHEVNRAFGRATGDHVLQYMTACIQSCLNEPDTLARLEGEGFAVLSMTVKDLDDAIELAKRIRKSVSQPFEIAGRRLEMTASLGVAMFPHHGEDSATLLHAARASMESAQQSKRGYRIYSAGMAADAEDQVALVHELHHAIANNELTLHYQPKIDLGVDRVSGVEALVRWQHPVNGLMPPERFLPLAEQIGIIQPLTNWVLDTALRQYQVWYQAGIRLPMSVKVTAASIEDPEFPAQMAKRLADFDVPASNVEIEIKETAAISDVTRVMGGLRQLRDMGFQIAIGDFGTGDSSVLYLSELLVANIKIDKALVTAMTENRGGTMAVRTAVKLGQTLGLNVVAKGVENQNSWDTLRGFGCNSLQGYYMSRPLPPVELVDWLHSSPWGAERVA